MPSFSVAKSANSSYTPSYIPTILITGATSGIGEAIAKSLANQLHGRGHFILIGRNRAAAEAIIASLPPAAQDSTYEFIACDVTLMKNIHEMTKDLLERLPKLNFLVHSAGVFSISGVEETEEGIDKKLAARYYSRWALTYDLLPLLRKAKELDEPASVLSVLGAGLGRQIDLDDLGLKKNYSGRGHLRPAFILHIPGRTMQFLTSVPPSSLHRYSNCADDIMDVVARKRKRRQTP